MGDDDANRPRLAWDKIVWLYLMLIPSVTLGWVALSVERAVICGAFGGVTLCLGHSVGLHRGVIHGAYQSSRWFRNLLVWLGVLTGVGGPLSMIRMHQSRDHWQNQPQSHPYFAYHHHMLRDFYWNLHTRFDPPAPHVHDDFARFESDRFLVWMERTWRAQILALAALLWATLGWEWVVVGVCMRTSAGILGHWSINYFTHRMGYMRYRLPGATEEGRNIRLLGWFSFGEGFHNNHHAYPASARMGHGGDEWDLGWAAIRLFEALGLVWGVKAYGREEDGRSARALDVTERHWAWRELEQPGERAEVAGS